MLYSFSKIMSDSKNMTHSLHFHFSWQSLITNFKFFNTLRLRQNGRHFPDDIFKCIFFNENIWISIKTSLKFVPEGPINNIPSLVQIMAWRRQGDKPLSEPMTFRLLTHICFIWPQCVKPIAFMSLETLKDGITVFYLTIHSPVADG